MMPEEERECTNEEDWYPWDADNGAMGESELADFLDDGEDE